MVDSFVMCPSVFTCISKESLCIGGEILQTFVIYFKGRSMSNVKKLKHFFKKKKLKHMACPRRLFEN